MTVIIAMDNNQNHSLTLGLSPSSCDSLSQKDDQPETKKIKNSEKKVLEKELITGRRRSRRGRPSPCTEFWIKFKTDTENEESGRLKDMKTQWIVPPTSLLEKDRPPTSIPKNRTSLSPPSPSTSPTTPPRVNLKETNLSCAASLTNTISTTSFISNLKHLAYNTPQSFSQANQTYQKMRTLSSIPVPRSFSNQGLKRKITDNRDAHQDFLINGQ